jgi:hypothetical protein
MDRALSRVFRDTRPHSTPVNPPVLHVEELLTALARKGIPLPFEMGAFLVLQTTEQILARKSAQPIAKVSPTTVWLSDDGELTLAETAVAPDQEVACKALVELLGALLVRSAPGVPPMLLELVERGPSDGAWTLSRLRDDLEAALLPLNRSATRRVLSRLLREVRREGERGARGPSPDARAIDRDVDALFGVEPNAASETEDELDVEVDAPQRPEREPPSRGTARGPRLAEPRAGGAPRVSMREDFVDPDTLSGGPSPAATLDDFEREVDDGEGRTGMRVGLAFLIAAVLLVAAYFAFARASG